MHTLCIHLSEFLFNEFLSSFFLYFILEADTFSIISSFLNWPKPNFTVASYSLCLIKKFCSIFLLSQIWVKYMFTVSGMMLFWLFPNCLIFSVTIGSTNSLCHCRGKYVINVLESFAFFCCPKYVSLQLQLFSMHVCCLKGCTSLRLCFICLTLPTVNYFSMHTLCIYLSEFTFNEFFSLFP